MEITHPVLLEFQTELDKVKDRTELTKLEQFGLHFMYKRCQEISRIFCEVREESEEMEQRIYHVMARLYP